MPTITQYVADEFLNKIKTATTLRVISGTSAPADRAEAISRTLGSIVVGSGDFGAIGDYGTATGRSMTGPVKNDVPFTVGGTAAMLTLDDGTTLLHSNGMSGTMVVTNGASRNVTYGEIRVPFAGDVA